LSQQDKLPEEEQPPTDGDEKRLALFVAQATIKLQSGQPVRVAEMLRDRPDLIALGRRLVEIVRDCLLAMSRRHNRRTISRKSFTIRSVQPGLLDLRFTGDVCVVETEDHQANVYIDDYRLSRIQISSLDTPTLNSIYLQLRCSRMRRKLSRKQREINTS
jgi:hypothetical protein